MDIPTVERGSVFAQAYGTLDIYNVLPVALVVDIGSAIPTWVLNFMALVVTVSGSA